MIFFQNFINNFNEVGAICPSSKFLGKSIYKLLSKEIQLKNQKILEIGGGTGSIGQNFIDFDLSIWEINDSFINQLNNKFNKFQNVKIENKNFLLEDINDKFDIIICTLPLSNFNQEKNNEISKKIKKLLNKSGSLIYFEYLFLSSREIKKLKDFKIVESKIELRNLPPARINLMKN